MTRLVQLYRGRSVSHSIPRSVNGCFDPHLALYVHVPLPGNRSPLVYPFSIPAVAVPAM